MAGPTALETAPPVTAVRIDEPGIFVRLEDVVATLRHVAEQYDAEQNPSGAISLRWCADYWESITVASKEIEPAQLSDETLPSVGEVVLDPSEVAGIEIFPDAANRWYARPVDADSRVLALSDGDIHKENVMRFIEENYPGVPIYEGPDELFDHLWMATGRKGPSPNRLYATSVGSARQS